jgi:hypothetical protein
MASIFRRVEAVGAVVDVEDAVAVKEAARPCAAVAEDPEENLNLDGCEVGPIGLGEWHRATGLLEHPVNGTCMEVLLGPSPQLVSVGRVTKAEAGELGAEGGEVRSGNRAEATPEGKHQLSSVEHGSHEYGGVDTVGEEGRELWRGARRCSNCRTRTSWTPPRRH